MEVINQTETVRGKTIIRFESGWQVWLTADQLPEFPLRKGTEIDRKEFEKFILLRQYPAALEKAVSMLALRPCSKSEIERKLISLHFDACFMEMVLYKLEKEKLLDDQQFTEQWIQSRNGKYGAGRIYRELIHKGIDSETAREALQSMDEEEQLEHAVSLAMKKLQAKPADTDRRKLFRQITGMLVRKGYSWEISKEAFEKAMRS